MIRPLLLALSLTFPAPVQAIERGAFLSTLSRSGISVVYRNQCGSDRRNIAVYYYEHNRICINNRLTPTFSDLDAALTHEAVHAVQDCLVGKHNGRMQSLSAFAGHRIDPFIRELRPGQLSFIQSNYPAKYWDLEIEAYALQDRPDDVAELLSTVCQ